MIMKYMIASLLVLLFFACNIPKDGEQENIATNKLEALTSLADIDTLLSTNENTNRQVAQNAEPLLIARGSEPGWYAEFFADHLNLLLNNGTDSLLVEEDFSKVNINKTSHVYAKAYNLKAKPEKKAQEGVVIVINIEDKSCIEEGSGEKREKSISIIYKHKVYKGCATTKTK